MTAGRGRFQADAGMLTVTAKKQRAFDIHGNMQIIQNTILR